MFLWTFLATVSFRSIMRFVKIYLIKRVTASILFQVASPIRELILVNIIPNETVKDSVILCVSS